jgi:hypothetical protein
MIPWYLNMKCDLPVSDWMTNDKRMWNMITQPSLGPLFLLYTYNHNKLLSSILTFSLYSNIRTSTKPGSLLTKLFSFLTSFSRKSFGRFSSLADSGHGVSSLSHKYNMRSRHSSHQPLMMGTICIL